MGIFCDGDSQKNQRALLVASFVLGNQPIAEELGGSGGKSLMSNSVLGQKLVEAGVVAAVQGSSEAMVSERVERHEALSLERREHYTETVAVQQAVQDWRRHTRGEGGSSGYDSLQVTVPEEFVGSYPFWMLPYKKLGGDFRQGFVLLNERVWNINAKQFGRDVQAARSAIQARSALLHAYKSSPSCRAALERAAKALATGHRLVIVNGSRVAVAVISNAVGKLSAPYRLETFREATTRSMHDKILQELLDLRFTSFQEEPESTVSQGQEIVSAHFQDWTRNDDGDWTYGSTNRDRPNPTITIRNRSGRILERYAAYCQEETEPFDAIMEGCTKLFLWAYAQATRVFRWFIGTELFRAFEQFVKRDTIAGGAIETCGRPAGANRRQLALGEERRLTLEFDGRQVRFCGRGLKNGEAWVRSSDAAFETMSRVLSNKIRSHRALVSSIVTSDDGAGNLIVNRVTTLVERARQRSLTHSALPVA